MKSVLITGAAKGIGLATAKQFAEQGWRVGLFDIDGTAIEQLLTTPEFANACGGCCDVSSRQSVEEAIKLFSDHTNGQLDVLVNNAGVLHGGEFGEMAADNINKMIAVNISGMTQVAHSAFALLKKTPNSTLINICSASSVYGFPILAVYSASKFYVRGFTEALNLEWAKHDIHVCSIKPPYVSTDMFDDVPSEATQRVAAEFTPAQVAQKVFAAAHNEKVAHLIGAKIRLWDFLVRMFPETIGRRLTKFLSGYDS